MSIIFLSLHYLALIFSDGALEQVFSNFLENRNALPLAPLGGPPDSERANWAFSDNRPGASFENHNVLYVISRSISHNAINRP